MTIKISSSGRYGTPCRLGRLGLLTFGTFTVAVACGGSESLTQPGASDSTLVSSVEAPAGPEPSLPQSREVGSSTPPPPEASSSNGVAAKVAAMPFISAFGFDPLSGYIDVTDQERRTADCMHSRGFEYVPFQPEVTNGIVERASVALTGRPDADLGYQLSSTLLDTASSPPQIADPNEAIRAGLGSQELTAYWVALRGVDPNAADGGPSESADGCIALSRSDQSAIDDQISQLLDSARKDVVAAAEADPAVVEADTEWVACMAKSGIVTSSKFAYLGSLRNEFAGLYDAVVASNAAGTPPQANADLLNFADHEGRLAKADLACDDLTGFTLDYLDAIGRAQQAFLDRNALVVGD